MPRTFPILHAEARSILSKTSGFIAEAGFTHSLTPARNCTFGCTYCYVPTLGVYGGLKPEDWQRWGQFTAFKTNAAKLLERSLQAREAAHTISRVNNYEPWLEPAFQSQIVERIRIVANEAGRSFATGPEAFSWLSKN